MWGLGAGINELISGVDCPTTSKFLDVSFLFDGELMTRKRVICIYEAPGVTTQRKHFDEGNLHYGGLPLHNLVVRIGLPTYNYDYTIDHIFYTNGALELKGSTTGYLQSTFWSSVMNNEVKSFGKRIHHSTAGTLHDHFFNFKIDLDIDGVSNSLRKSNIIAVKENSFVLFIFSPFAIFLSLLLHSLLINFLNLI